MPSLKSPAWAVLPALLLAALLGPVAGTATAQDNGPANATCLACHRMESLAKPMPNGEPRQLYVSPADFEQSVHGKRSCVECHKDITAIPHRKGVDRKVGCVQCHEDLWQAAQDENRTEELARLGEVVQQIDSYMSSIHARPNREDQSRTNATCYDCHDAHYIAPIDSQVGARSRLKIPEVCGKCHSDITQAYRTSVHGQGGAVYGNAHAAVCIDCHTTHDIESPGADTTRLAITRNCGTCHAEELESYLGTYHGQVSTLGYTHTAKCYECHGHHEIKRVADESSIMHENNRLETCSTCHPDATAGYVSFQPHGNTHDFDRYPQMWIASKFMISLLAGVFIFFWTHAALWFYREYKDRKEGKNKLYVQTDGLPDGDDRYIRRFSGLWRLAHLIGAVSIMLLVLTGTAVLYADSFWAPTVIAILGGPKSAAILHRIGAVLFMVVFFGHLIYFAFRIGRTWRTFRWFGPDSLIPNWQDLKDCAAMFRWFFGKGPRPRFDRWTYYEKFDYWAPFWGMFIIGVSGAMLWFPSTTASVLPGWVFNVGTIVHGEEAFLAAVFLFTVHFFNVHFRPDKFPQDIVMFTGALTLEEFRREHGLQYRRLLEEGRLDDYLVDAPSAPMTRYSEILGGTLIIVGLSLLILVLSGFLGHVF
ncbi:MAG: cytochrome c3 family protein [Gammaproteobacteria bacterium]|nr:cytochrome c3 family protein [Gammaproteobacteria bacterium]